MPCHSAIVEKIEMLKPTDTVARAYECMAKSGQSYLPVVEEDGKLVGAVSIKSVFKNLTQVSVLTSEGGHKIGVMVDSAPGIAKRYKKIKDVTLDKIMERRVNIAYRETPIWQGIKLLMQYEMPLMIVDEESGKLCGVVTELSAFKELERLQNE